jgi:hypothetical protein
VLDQLHREHEVIAEQSYRVAQALLAMMNDSDKLGQVRRVADQLGDMLLSHLAYEEDELLVALGRLELQV